MNNETPNHDQPLDSPDARALKLAYREPPSYEQGSPAAMAVKRSTVSEGLIESAKHTASSWEQPAYIGGTMARLEDVASTEPVVSTKRPEYLLATVYPDGLVELEAYSYRKGHR